LIYSCVILTRLSVVLITFLFYLSLPPPDLHSFPTRRSSDLLAHIGTIFSFVVPPYPELTGMKWSRCWYSDSHTEHLLENLFKISDRKSTRLNSSHVSISYAVFCLKKKKYKIYTNRH